MSLADFIATQNANAATYSKYQHFTALVPLVERMYEAAKGLASDHSPTLGRLLLSCHREFLVAASLIQRCLAVDAHANTRRAVEAAKLALALKRDVNNGEEWLKEQLRKRRWQAREQGKKPERPLL